MAGLSLDLIGLQLFTGLALGALYVLLALGLSLIFGMLTIVNFAHGAFYMLGAYVGLWLMMRGANFGSRCWRRRSSSARSAWRSNAC